MKPAALHASRRCCGGAGTPRTGGRFRTARRDLGAHRSRCDPPSSELVAFGRVCAHVRRRAVRHVDLAAWIASRALKPVEGIDDADIARRVNRLAQLKRSRTPGPVE